MDNDFNKFREGDEQAFERLFRSFFPYARRFAVSMLGDDPAVNDLIQDAFVHIWHKRGIFQDENHLKGYIYKSLRNNIAKHIGQSSRIQPLSGAREVTEDDVFAGIIELEVQREVAQAIATLPAEQRKVILLAISGMTVEQIAERLGISVNTVKTQKKRAYSTLRKELKGLSSLFIPFL